MKYYTSTTEFNCGIDLHARRGASQFLRFALGHRISQRDYGLQPKVGASAYLGLGPKNDSNANGVAARAPRAIQPAATALEISAKSRG